MHKILITGGAGFIGSHLVRFLVNQYPHYQIINLDALTYASNLTALAELSNYPNYQFVKADVTDYKLINHILQQLQPDTILHLAAYTHVDHSINQPLTFATTNVIGTVNLLNAALQLWQNNLTDKLFFYMSTDEVFGSLNNQGLFTEQSNYNPRSPYSASKASADHFVQAFANTYAMPIIIAHSSNNFGTNQHPEKLIPLTINHLLNNKPVPIYGDGKQIRDWIHVSDCVSAIDCIMHQGKTKQSYNIGANNQWQNIDLVKLICTLVDEKLNRPNGSSQQLISFVADRPGHDYHYAIDNSKLKQLGWQAKVDFTIAIKQLIDTIIAQNSLS